jgi:hypothetical protein
MHCNYCCKLMFKGMIEYAEFALMIEICFFIESYVT